MVDLTTPATSRTPTIGARSSPENFVTAARAQQTASPVTLSAVVCRFVRQRK
jgi:hypothetical protein